MTCAKAVIVLLIAAVASPGQQSGPRPGGAKVMLAAVSRDEDLLRGGIGPSKWTGRGTVAVEPLAFVTEAGEWSSIPCSTDNQKNCVKFQREYLSKPQDYTVVGPDGKGAMVRSKPTTLSECFDYGGSGTYSGGAIEKSTIAASSPEMFGDSEAARPVGKEDTLFIRKLLAEIVPKKLDSANGVRVLSVDLEGQNLNVLQRAFADVPDSGQRSLIFGIGVVEPHRLHLLYWKQNTADENERVLGTIRLKSGRDFLITVVSDPESHSYHVYGIRDGKLSLIYAGGGSSC
jgi:hypothetical protein